MRYSKVCLLTLFTYIASASAYAQLSVSPNQTAAVLATKLAGPGISIMSPVLTCKDVANGTFTSVTTPITIDSGILLTTGKAASAAGTESTLASTSNGTAGDAALTTLAMTTTYDACILEFDFIPHGDTISFNYQFGSEEYINSTCGPYNDAFAFFISGPGIVGTQNLALAPGTTIPITVNSVNSGVPGPGYSLATCNAMGPGSPFTSYYYDNTGGTQVTYRGYTTKLLAVHDVIPCNTYHLKLTIADAGNKLYDSGVFIEAGSLKSNSFVFNRADSIGATINGAPHTIVKGCSPATVNVSSSRPVTTDQTIYISTGGTAVSGTDYTALPDSVIIPAGDSTASINVQGLATAVAGTKTLTIYLQPYANCGIVDSIQLNILDTPTANIITPDTSVCPGAAFQIHASGSTGLAYSWSPATGLSSPTVMQPTATLFATTTYTMSATLPGSGCTPIVRTLTVTVNNAVDFTILTPDTSICNGQSVNIRVDGSDSLTYSWSPAAALSNSTIKNPTATPTSTTTFNLTVFNPSGCNGVKQVTIAVVDLNTNITTPDTAICLGGSVQVMGGGTTGAAYQWLPTAGIAVSNVLDPLITPDTSATYYLLGSLPGCSGIMDSIKIDVQPNPVVYIGGSRAVCQFDTLHIAAYVKPEWYAHYSYSWSPATNLDNTSSSAVIFTAGDSTNLILHVTTPAGCNSVDSAMIIVHPGNFATISNDTGVCPRDSIQLMASGGATYGWHPGTYLDDSTSATPWIHAITSIDYTLTAVSQYGCYDTLHTHIEVHPDAVVYLGDSTTLYPGETYQISPQTNCTSFVWFPPSGLNDAYISNPLAMPEVSTKYVVHATTEWGCMTTDSISIYVNPESVLTLPNAFTPGTGVNSVLSIIKRGQATLQYFRIFNRWGNKVYESDNIDGGWDGSYNGKPQPLGVYVYELQAVTSTGRVFTKQGNITLLR